MDVHSILLMRIEALREDLNHIENMLNALRARADVTPARPRSNSVALLDRVKPRFDYLIQKGRTDLDELETKLGNKAPSDCWKDLRNIRKECKKLFQACLALIEGSLLRQHGLDGGLCRIADALLDELSFTADETWRRFTIWADAESFANLDEVIRVRFPSLSIWHLPVAAHEFGHFVAQSLVEPGTSRHPFEEFCDDYKSMGESRFLQEYFADVFATYAIGPAYACERVVLRFDHGAANLLSKTHPSDARRVYALMWTLKKMDEKEAIPNFEFIHGRLSKIWRESLSAAFQQADLEQGETVELDKMLEAIYDILKRDLPPRLRYDRWVRAQELASVLQSPGTAELKLNMLRNGDSIIDIVNAAWWSRLVSGDGQSARELSDTALTLCNRLISQFPGH